LSPWTDQLRITPASIPGDPEAALLSSGEDHVLIGWEPPSDDVTILVVKRNPV